MIKSVYIIGALKNWNVIKFGNALRKQGFDAFDSWISPGPKADSFWRDYTRLRGMDFKEALHDWSAQHVFQFDKFHLDRCDAAVLLMPAGKSACLELGYVIGCGKKGFVLYDKNPERYDVMMNFATDIFFSQKDLFKALKSVK